MALSKAQQAEVAKLVAAAVTAALSGTATKPKAGKAKSKAGKVATAQRMFQERGYKCLEPECGKGFRTLGHYTSPTDWAGLTGHKATAHKS